MLPHFEDVVAEALVVYGVGAILVITVEQALQLSLRREKAFVVLFRRAITHEQYCSSPDETKHRESHLLMFWSRLLIFFKQ